MICKYLSKILPSFLFKKKTTKKYVHTDILRYWTPIELDIFLEINDYLISIGKNGVLSDDNLNKECDIRTLYLSDINKITHKGSKESFDRLKELGIKHCAEILEVNHDNAKDIINAWKNSPGHNRILSSGIYKYVGVSRIEEGPLSYCCVIFAS